MDINWISPAALWYYRNVLLLLGLGLADKWLTRLINLDWLFVMIFV